MKWIKSNSKFERATEWALRNYTIEAILSLNKIKINNYNLGICIMNEKFITHNIIAKSIDAAIDQSNIMILHEIQELITELNILVTDGNISNASLDEK